MEAEEYSETSILRHGYNMQELHKAQTTKSFVSTVYFR